MNNPEENFDGQQQDVKSQNSQKSQNNEAQAQNDDNKQTTPLDEGKQNDANDHNAGESQGNADDKGLKYDKSLQELCNDKHSQPNNNRRNRKNKKGGNSQNQNEDGGKQNKDSRSFSPGEGNNNFGKRNKYDKQGNKNDGGGNKHGEVGAKVIAKNLDYNTTWHSLKDFMKTVGHVQYADILKAKDGRSKGIGVVEFKTVSDAQRAVEELNRQQLDGRQVFLKMDQNDARNTEYFDDNNQQQQNQYNDNQGRGRQNNRNNNYDQGDNYNNKGGRNDRFRGGLASSYQDNQPDRDNGRDHGFSGQGRGRSRSGSRGARREGGRGFGQYDGQQGGQNDGLYRRDNQRNAGGGGGGLQIQKRGEMQKQEKNHYTSQFRMHRQIFISNMPFSVTRNQFYEAFDEFGEILEVNMQRDPNTGKPNGRGYILFKEIEAAEDAVRVMDQAKFNDRVVVVKEDEVIHSSYQHQEENNMRSRGGDYQQSDRDDYQRNERGRSRERNYGGRNYDHHQKGNRSNSYGDDEGSAYGNQRSYGGRGGENSNRERYTDNRDFNRNRNNNNRY